MAKDKSPAPADAVASARLDSPLAIPEVPSAADEAKLPEVERRVAIPQWLEGPDGTIRCDAREAKAWEKRGYLPVTVVRAAELDEARDMAILEAEIKAEKQREADKLTRLERELAELRAAQAARR